MEERLFLAADPIVFANVFLKSPSGELTLFFRQPLSGTREIGEDEKGRECNYHGNCALDDKQPSPMDKMSERSELSVN